MIAWSLTIDADRDECGHTGEVITARWNWIALVVVSGAFLFIALVGIFVGALSVTQEPIAFLGVSVTFLICAFVVRRSYKRYEAEVLPIAAADLEAERTADEPTV
jgi:hypothetical protein